MLTPKEKAEELVNSFVKLYDHQSENYLELDEAKLCALIAVDEILNNDGFTKFDYYLTKYWIEVKKEINLL
jgi:hypothetical protein